MRTDFAIFILSHGRANNLRTVKMLQKYNYDGLWYIVIDTDDDQIDDYKHNFGEEHIIVFDKDDVADKFDIMDSFDGRQVPTYGRNYLFILAKQMGLKYFLELEDDYFAIRSRKEDSNGVLRTQYIVNLSDYIDPMLEFLDVTGAITVAWAQTGDLIGGKGSKVYKDIVSRKAMQSFFCRVDRPFDFIGRFNDDVNMYITNGTRGKLVLSIRDLCVDQPMTQVNSGGIKDAYKQFGTYVKSFYSVMLCPSSVKIYTMGDKHHRIHHQINHENTYVKIISDKYKKTR